VLPRPLPRHGAESYDRLMAQQRAEGTEWDVIVVGAGIIGCAVAREVAVRGAKTMILEGRSAGAGATHASAGVLAPYIEAPSDGPLHALTVESLGLYDDFIKNVAQESSLPIEYRRCGTLELAHDSNAAEQLQTLCEWIRSKGVEAQWIESPGVARLEPALGPTSGGLLVPSHGYVRAAQLTDALLDASRRYGAAAHLGRRVDSITGEGDRAIVTSGDDTYRARTVVVAAGSWSSELARETDVAPVRGQLLHVRWQGPPLHRILWSESCYLVPWLDGTLLVGATVEQVGFDERVTAGGVKTLLNAASAVLPGVSDATFVEARVGLRPSTPSGLPIIRRSARHSALIYATGHFRNGILLAPLTATVVADLIA
jgi:glycine oxidase